MKQVDITTLEMKDISKENASKQYVFILRDEGSWDYEHTSSADVFATFDLALEEFKKRIVKSKQDMETWCSKEDIKEDQLIDRENNYASYDTYEQDEYDRLHNTLIVERKEIIK